MPDIMSNIMNIESIIANCENREEEPCKGNCMEKLEKEKHELACHVQTPSLLESCNTMFIVRDTDVALLGFAEKLEKWTEKSIRENEFGTAWLGNLVLSSKIGTVETGKDTDVFCDGMIVRSEILSSIDAHPDSFVLIIKTETYGEPALKMWKLIFEKFLPHAEYLFYSSSPDLGVSLTNDKEFQDHYVVFYENDLNIVELNCLTEQELKSLISATYSLKQPVSMKALRVVTEIQRLTEMKFNLSKNQLKPKFHPWIVLSAEDIAI